MKYILIGMIRIYQLLPFSSHIKCRFIPTCSNYGIEAINRYGSIKGSILTIKMNIQLILNRTWITKNIKTHL